MADITPSALANSIMGKLYDVLTNGDVTERARHWWTTGSKWNCFNPGIYLQA